MHRIAEEIIDDAKKIPFSHFIFGMGAALPDALFFEFHVDDLLKEMLRHGFIFICDDIQCGKRAAQIFFISSFESVWNTSMPSIRLMNSGRNVLPSSSITPDFIFS